MSPATPSSARPRVNLALQGGGAHGAFTWGVLDRLLEDGRHRRRRHLRHQCRGHERGRHWPTAWPAAARPRRARRSPASGRCSPSAPASARCSRPRSTGRCRSATWTTRPAGCTGMRCRAWCRPMSPIPPTTTRWPRCWTTWSTSPGCARTTPSRCSSAPPTSRPARSGCSAATRSRPRRSWPRPACRSSTRRSRSTASTTGTAASWAIRRSTR